MASKMTEKDCEAFIRKLSRDKIPFDQFSTEFWKRLPNEADQKYLRDWIDKDTVKQLTKNVSGVQPLPARFVQEVEKMNFHNYKKTADLERIMIDNIRPLIPMGIDADTGVGYRLVPEPYGLVPQTWKVDEKESRQVLRSSYLGVNTNVQPPPPPPPPSAPKASSSRREHNFSEQSTKTTESESTGPGFHFHQIGTLQFFIGEYPETKRERDDGAWMDTGFCLVAELTNAGLIQDYWIIYNMWPIDEEGERFNIDYTEEDWGTLPDSSQQFSCAKMQPKSAFGNPNTKVTWVDRVDHPVELVRCVKGSSGEVLRITVEEEDPELGGQMSGLSI